MLQKTLSAANTRSVVAPHAHYVQLTRCRDTTFRLVLSVGGGSTCVGQYTIGCLYGDLWGNGWMCLYDAMVRVRIFASLNHVWHMRGFLRCHFNLARVRMDVYAIKFRLANEGLNYWWTMLGPLPSVTSAPIVSVPNSHPCAYRLEFSCSPSVCALVLV